MDWIAREHGINSMLLFPRGTPTPHGPGIHLPCRLRSPGVRAHCVLLVVYDYASGVARERFADALNSLCRSVMTNLDSQVSEIDRLSLTMIYSPVFQSLFARHLAFPRNPSTVEQRITKLQNTEALIEISETILGPNRSAPQANVYDLRGEMIGAGYYSRLIERDVSHEPWYRGSSGQEGNG